MEIIAGPCLWATGRIGTGIGPALSVGVVSAWVEEEIMAAKSIWLGLRCGFVKVLVCGCFCGKVESVIGHRSGLRR